MRDLSPVLPSAVLVRFLVRRCAGSPDDSYPRYYTKEISVGDITLSLTDGAFTGHPGKKEFNETALALYGTVGGPPTNQVALDSLAGKIAESYFNWRTVSYDFTFNGLVFPEIDGGIDMVEWIYDDEDVITRIKSDSFNCEPEELMHYDTAAVGCIDSDAYSTVVSKLPSIEMYGPLGTDGGSMVLPVFLVKLIDSRLELTYERTETIPCGCVEAPTCQLCTTATDFCTTKPVPGATVTVTQGGTTIGTCTTGADGKCCVDIPASGTYTVACSEGHYEDPDALTLGVICPGVTNAGFVLHPISGRYFITINLWGEQRVFDNTLGTISCAVLPLGQPTGPTMTVDDGMGFSSSLDGSYGIIDVPGPGTYTASGIWLPRYDVGSSEVVITEATCGNSQFADVTLPIEADYVCTPFCRWPIKPILHVVDPLYGTFDLTWDGTSIYEGTETAFFPGNATCPPENVSVTFQLIIVITGAPGSYAINLVIHYTVTAGTDCPGPGVDVITTGATADPADPTMVVCPPGIVLFKLETPGPGPGGCTGGSFCTPLYPGVYVFFIQE
jgi:hypothetical protein